ncbi:MAG: 1-(5-phosphoribosyl)-5-amino-4-imidazole-carboxylate carboxylase, partial [Myxococcota bacterium]
MNRDNLRALLTGLVSGQRDIDSVMELLEKLPYEDMGFARIDHHRQLRTGMPEVVFGEGKTPEHTAQIVERMATRGSNVLVTRLAPKPAEVTLGLLARRREEG